ncbi:PBECR2 nuclease fold domain-containing protein [Peptoniphilus harei]|uniref:PBECR3 domain-containing polyvalent protein n=1 Tax=Peptoniphilus harei TaxID=54005 RepID=UPI0037041E64
MVKRKHYDFLKYFEEIDNIIKNPDYVGTSPREKDVSIEYVKCCEDNVLVVVKLNRKKSVFYITSMYIISEYKLESRIKRGRLIKIDENCE